MTATISVLIVEDHEATLKGLRAELSLESDLKVVGIASGSEEGLRLATELKPAVILLDLHLPDSSGPKSLAQRFCSLSDTRVIVFSGDNRTAILNLVLGTGVAAYLLKSEPIAKVAQTIRDVFSRNEPIISSDLVKTTQPRITKTEEHLLRMLSRGMKYQDIAAMRVTAPETVRKQVDSLTEKLALNSREELIAWAVDNGYHKLELEP